MATASVTYQPAAGREYVDLTGWTGSALFSATPVSGDQIEGPDSLTYPANDDPTGADGTYTLRHIKLDGSIEAVSYTITTADTQEPTLTSPSATVTGSTTLDASVSTNEANGTLYTLASANATETASTVKASGQSQVVSAAGVQSVSVTGLTASTPYYVHFMHEDAAANQSAVSTSAQVTTDAAPTTSSATATVAYVAPTGKTAVTLATGFDDYIFQEWAAQPVVGEQIVFTDSELTIDELANVTTDTEAVFDVWFVELDGTVTATTIDTTGLTAVDGTAPTVSSAAVPAAGDVIAVQMSEAMQVGAGGSGGWTISLGDATISSAAVDGSDATIINLTPSRTLRSGDTFTIAYTQPGDGFQDQAATPNDLTTFSGQAVTNNSTQSPPDVTDPEVLSVSATAAGSYKAGDTLSLTVATDENVTVVTTGGTPYVPVTIGSTVRQFTYASGSGTQSLVFSYTIQAGDNDANGIAVGSSIVANGATLKDAAGNALVLTLNSVADTSGILVDTIKPIITPDGNNPYTHIEGTTYNDPGATAVDDQDGNLGSVTGTHSIDENITPGEYTVTYSGTGITDTAGNEADDATRTVVVIAVSASAGGRRAFMRSCVRSSVKSSVGDFKA